MHCLVLEIQSFHLNNNIRTEAEFWVDVTHTAIAQIKKWNGEQTQEVQKDHKSTWISWLCYPWWCKNVITCKGMFLLEKHWDDFFFSYTHRDTMQSNIHSLMVQWQWELFCLPEYSSWNKDLRQIFAYYSWITHFDCTCWGISSRIPCHSSLCTINGLSGQTTLL